MVSDKNKVSKLGLWKYYQTVNISKESGAANGITRMAARAIVVGPGGPDIERPGQMEVKYKFFGRWWVDET